MEQQLLLLMPPKPVAKKTSVARRVHRGLLFTVHTALAAVILGLAIRGLDYYLTPVSERAHHAQYWLLKPGGQYGLVFGYVGTGMMTLLLLYSVRKRIPGLRRLGALSKWLDWHIVMGIYGPLFVVLHSSLKAGGIVSIAFWSMLTVATSGIFGRYLYLQIPRSQNGHALTLKQLQAKEASFNSDLFEQTEISKEHVATLDVLAASSAGQSGPLLFLPLTLPFSHLRLRRSIRREVSSWSIGPAHHEQVLALALAKSGLHSRLVVLARVQKLFHYWHVFHKPFAVIMYILVVLHIAVAWTMGYGGPFG